MELCQESASPGATTDEESPEKTAPNSHDAMADNESSAFARQKELAYFQLFGRQGRPQNTKAMWSSWKTHEFVNQTRIPWHIPLAPLHLSRLIEGYIPQSMEDKWFIYSDGPIMSTHDGDWPGTLKSTVHYHHI